MFRKLARFKQQLPEAECLDVLKTQLRGVLAVQGDGGYPYALPINHYYCEEDGRIYFHSGPSGHKIDALLRDPKASLCVMDEGVRKEGDWFLTFRSVIVFGQIEVIRDRSRIYELSRRLSRKFIADEAYIQHEIESSGPATFMFALVPENICGKRVREKEAGANNASQMSSCLNGSFQFTTRRPPWEPDTETKN